MTDEFDAACLAACLFGKEEPDTDDQVDQIEEQLMERFNICLGQLSDLIDLLMPFCSVGRSPLTDTIYRGFAKDGCFIVKTEVK
jgi:hypothetical protein